MKPASPTTQPAQSPDAPIPRAQAEPACQATPHEELLRKLMDSRIAKNELEHFAAREITRLVGELFDAKDEAIKQDEEVSSLEWQNDRLRSALERCLTAIDAGFSREQREHIKEQARQALSTTQEFNAPQEDAKP